MRIKQKAFSSFEFLIILFILSVIGIATSFFIKNIVVIINKEEVTQKVQDDIEKTLEMVMKDLLSDETPLSDSRNDKFWKWNEKIENECKVTIRSLSSLLNINYFPEKIFTTTNLKNIFLDSNSPTIMQSQKKINGLYFIYDDVSDYISKENYDKYFTSYGWANFNISDEDGVKLILQYMLDSISISESFCQKRHSILKNKQVLQTKTEYKLFCGTRYDRIMPYVNLEPLMNVNFIEPEILKSILSYKEFKISGVNQKADEIISLRDNTEITQKKVMEILNINKGNELYYLLGTITWFWEIKITKGKQNCTVIVYRLPEKSDTSATEKPLYYILEKSWS